MAQAEITSTGKIGMDLERSDGRAYLTMSEIVTNPDDLILAYTDLSEQSEQYGRRRKVLRARCSNEVILALTEQDPNAFEVAIPLRLFEEKTEDYLIVMGANVHPSPVPEWDAVYQYWESQNGQSRTPVQIVEQLPTQFQLVQTFNESDVPELRKLWNAFGWSKEGLMQLRQNAGNGITFSGVRDMETGKIVSATMGEILSVAGVNLAETTEYSTDPKYRKLGLCTASVIGLSAQLLNKLEGLGGIPLIFAELNMSSRSDIVARHAGFTIPGVEGEPGLTTPHQVLRANVAVLDGMPANNLNWRDLGSDRNAYRAAFAFPHRYTRNFVAGTLTAESIRMNYSGKDRARILARYGD